MTVSLVLLGEFSSQLIPDATPASLGQGFWNTFEHFHRTGRSKRTSHGGCGAWIPRSCMRRRGGFEERMQEVLGLEIFQVLGMLWNDEMPIDHADEGLGSSNM